MYLEVWLIRNLALQGNLTAAAKPSSYKNMWGRERLTRLADRWLWGRGHGRHLGGYGCCWGWGGCWRGGLSFGGCRSFSWLCLSRSSWKIRETDDTVWNVSQQILYILSRSGNKNFIFTRWQVLGDTQWYKAALCVRFAQGHDMAYTREVLNPTPLPSWFHKHIGTNKFKHFTSKALLAHG